MSTANALAGTISRLFGGIADPAAVRTQAAKKAHAATARRYAKHDPSLFSLQFLQTEGMATVTDFLDGKQSRHEAAQALSHAWNMDLGPISSRARKMRIADTTMMADIFLTELGKLLDR